MKRTICQLLLLIAGTQVPAEAQQYEAVDGMGNLFITALQNIDFNVMLGWLLVTAALVIIFNLIADILYGVLDPRIRHA